VRTRPACGEGSAELQCGAYLAERGLATLSLREGIAVAQTARASQLLSVVIQPPPFASGRGSGVSAGALAEEDAQGEGGRIYIYTAAFGDGLWPHEIVRDSLHHAARAAAPRLSRRGPVYTYPVRDHSRACSWIGERGHARCAAVCWDGLPDVCRERSIRIVSRPVGCGVSVWLCCEEWLVVGRSWFDLCARRVQRRASAIVDACADDVVYLYRY